MRWFCQISCTNAIEFTDSYGIYSFWFLVYIWISYTVNRKINTRYTPMHPGTHVCVFCRLLSFFTISNRLFLLACVEKVHVVLISCQDYTNTSLCQFTHVKNHRNIFVAATIYCPTQRTTHFQHSNIYVHMCQQVGYICFVEFARWCILCWHWEVLFFGSLVLPFRY